MKKMTSILMLFILLIITAEQPIAANTSSSTSKEIVVQFSGGAATVKAVWVDLNDPTIRLDTICANNQVGMTDSLKDIANLAVEEGTQVLAAINGTYFNAYSDLQPSGTIISEGDALHIVNSGSIFGMDGDNNFSIVPLSVKIEGCINNSWSWPNNWYAWNINHVFTDAASSVIFTPDYGKKTAVHTMTSIVVDNHVVTKMVKGQVDIPSQGFVLVTGDQSQIDKFQVGFTVDYRVKYNENDYNSSTSDQPLDWDNIRSGIGAGPLLLIDSVIVVDPKAEGFTEDKILTLKATRSFIGITNSNQLVIGVANNVTVKEMAEIAKNMGLTDAMCLDGGASSGLLYNNTYIIQPGRDLSNAVVITKLDKAPVRIKIDGVEIYFDVDPFIETPANRTLVPMRKIFEVIGATVNWNASERSITAVKDGITIYLKIDSDVALVDNQEFILECPAHIKSNRTFVPLRFITEQFGYDVDWVDGVVILTSSGQ